MGSQISTEQRGRVVIARFDNPPYGLMTMPMVEELNELVRRAEKDDGIGAVVLTGAQPDLFLAHYDVAELLAAARQSPPISEARASIALRLIRRLTRIPGLASRLEDSQVGGVVSLQRFHETLLMMGRSGVVYIAAINGATAGGGLELALACDLRYISERGELAQPEVLLGFPPGGGGTQRMARLIGRAAALQIMLTGSVVTPSDAERVGLVNKVVPHDGLLEAACTTAEQLSMRYKPAVSVIKRAVLEGGSMPLEDGLRVEQAGLLAMFGHPKVQAAMAAYGAFIEENQTLPAYDPDARQQLQDGTFSPFVPAQSPSSAD